EHARGEWDGPRNQQKPPVQGVGQRWVGRYFKLSRHVLSRNGRARSVSDSILGHAEDRLRLAQVRGVDQSSKPFPAFRLPPVDAERRAVADDVPANRPGGIPEERIGL